MSYRASPVRPLTAVRTKGLSGRLRVPGDAAISQLALILGASARGETMIAGSGESEDVAATRRALQALGARIEQADGMWRVTGLGVGGLLAPSEPLDFGAGQGGLALMMGLVGPYGFVTRFVGQPTNAGLRPLERAFDALRAAGVEIVEQRGGGLPVSLRGPRTRVPVDFRLPPHAGEIKTLLLLAGLAVPGTTILRGAGAVSGDAETLLQAFGASIESHAGDEAEPRIEVAGLPELLGQNIEVPGDFDVAALLLVAGLIVPGSDITIENVPIGGSGASLVDLLRQMGGSIEVLDSRPCGSWQVADLQLRHSPLKVVSPPAGALAVGEASAVALAIAAAFAEGETRVDLGDLTGDSDWPAALVRGLVTNGVGATLRNSVLTIACGGKSIGGATVATGGDAVLAMGFLLLGLAAGKAVTIDDESPIGLHFPGFIPGIEKLGAKFFKRVPS